MPSDLNKQILLAKIDQGCSERHLVANFERVVVSLEIHPQAIFRLASSFKHLHFSEEHFDAPTELEVLIRNLQSFFQWVDRSFLQREQLLGRPFTYLEMSAIQIGYPPIDNSFIRVGL